MKRVWALFGLFAAILVVSIAAPSVQAKTAEGIQVKPIRNYPSLDRGTTGKGSLTLTNITDKTQTVSMAVEKFSVVNEDYDYSFGADDEIGWIVFEEDNLTLKPNQKKTVTYNIAVPGDASPGGHYFSLLTILDPPKDAEGVTEIRRVASLLYLEISGDITKKSSLTDFSPPWFSTSPTVPADIFISNNGTSHTRARVLVEGQVWLQQLLKRPKVDFALYEGTILPGTVRKIPGDIQLPNRPGVYVLSANYSPAEGSATSIRRIVVYAPIWFLIVFFLTLFAIILTTVRFLWPHIQKVKHLTRSGKFKKSGR